MTLGFAWLRALRRDQHDKALAVGGEIEVHTRTEVRSDFNLGEAEAELL
jgi:hypothetical protein